MAAIYTRGVNPPYTEGHLVSANCMAKAIALAGWTALVLNFSYRTTVLKSFEVIANQDSGIRNVDIRIPGIDRDILIHSPNVAFQALASSAESLFFPFLMTHELRGRVSLVHLLNCFKFPRRLIRAVRKTPVIDHVYQTPKSLDVHLPLDAIVASSKRIARILRSQHIDTPPIYFIPPAVDTDFYRPTSYNHQAGKTALYIGNLSADRLPNRFFNIIKEILGAYPSVTFKLIAPINRVNAVRIGEINTICQSLQIKERVHVSLRNMNDDQKLKEYLLAKLFIFPPLKEQRHAIEPPLTVLEALSSGVPVVATNTYSVAEALNSERNGYVVDVDDYSRLTERALEILKADQNKWLSWSEEARKTAAEKFSIYSASRRYQRMHSTVLEASKTCS